MFLLALLLANTVCSLSRFANHNLVIVTPAYSHPNAVAWLTSQYSRIVAEYKTSRHWRVAWFISLDGVSPSSPDSQMFVAWAKSVASPTAVTVLNSTAQVTPMIGARALRQLPIERYPIIILCHAITELNGARHRDEPIGDIVHKNFAGFWVYHLDADNLLHCRFMTQTNILVTTNPNSALILFSQQREEAQGFLHPWSPRYESIDTGQFIMRIDEIQKHNLQWQCLRCGHAGDGPFIEAAFNALKYDSSKVLATNEVLSYHNRFLWAEPIGACQYNPLETDIGARIRDPLNDYAELYRIYADDLAAATKLARAFCAREAVLRAGLPHYRACLTGLLESELLYLRIRFYRPNVVVEVSSALGYSTLWILLALEHNNEGRLYSFDFYKTPFPFVLDDSLRQRWEFYQGDMRNTYMKHTAELDIDYLHIDTCHEEDCIKWYLPNVLETSKNHRTSVVHVSAHDAYDTYYKSDRKDPLQTTREGTLIVEWLAFSGRSRLFHTVAPGLSRFIDALVVERNKIVGNVLEESLIGDWWHTQPFHGDIMCTMYFDYVNRDNDLQCANCEKAYSSNF
jgi:hypothetical protein